MSGASRFGVLLSSEMRALVRQPGLHVLVSLYIGTTSGLALLLYLIGYWSNPNALVGNSEVGNAILFLLAVVQVLLCSLAPAPLGAANAGPKPRTTLAWLRLAAFSPAQIVLARWVAICAWIGIMAASLLPLFSLAFLLRSASVLALVALGSIVLSAIPLFTALSLAAWISLNSRISGTATALGVGAALLFLWPLSCNITLALIRPMLPAGLDTLLTITLAGFSPLMTVAFTLPAQLSATTDWTNLFVASTPQPWPSALSIHLSLSAVVTAVLLWIATRGLQRVGEDELEC
ncbi:MAG: hypothetical protein ACK4WM_08220 [Thermoflexales bacterium]